MKKSILLLFAALLPLVANAQTKVEIDGIWYNLVSKAKQAEVTSSDGTEYSGSITLPATVTHNGVEYSVTSIESYAFSSCSSLTAITIPEGVTSIGEWAFAHCSGLTAITLPKNSKLESIENWAFEGCSNLTAITIPESVTSIGGGAFSDCHSLTAITIPDNSQLTSIGYCAFKGCSSLTAITLPEGVTSIGTQAFDGCSSLTTINIPENSKLESIGEAAFYYCSSLTAITIPESVTSIGERAFYDCSSLTAITIPENLKLENIGGWTFYNCSSLTTITIPEGVTSIGVDAFAYCSSLTAITIPESVTEIISGESGAFRNCSSLTAITIPEGVTSIEGRAFDGCSSLTTVTIPRSMTSIGAYAFSGCSSLTSIVLPKNLKNIGTQAFANCSELLDVYCYAEEVPWTVADAFDNSYPEYITLHVPASALNAYKTTAPWSGFGNIVVLEDEEPLEKCATPTIGYADGKVVFACDTEGATVKSSTTVNGAGDRNVLEFALIPTYTITAYATKANYEKSDVATLTLCWIPCDEHEEDNGILTIPSTPVLISARDGVLTLSGLAEGTEVTLYTTDGTMVAHQQSSAGEAKFTVDTNQVYLVHIGDKVVKIGM